MTKFLMILTYGGCFAIAAGIEWARRAHKRRVEKRYREQYKNSRLKQKS